VQHLLIENVAFARGSQLATIVTTLTLINARRPSLDIACWQGLPTVSKSVAVSYQRQIELLACYLGISLNTVDLVLNSHLSMFVRCPLRLRWFEYFQLTFGGELLDASRCCCSTFLPLFEHSTLKRHRPVKEGSGKCDRSIDEAKCAK
jgi:hypothetical protein